MTPGIKTSGDHDYSLPFGLLKDQTDKGFAWDITQNYRGFWYTPSTGEIDGAGSQPEDGTSWLNFGGMWGDQQWPTNEFGQYCIDNQCHITDGPTGKHAAHASTRELPTLTRLTR